jgi:hypothetical protein
MTNNQMKKRIEKIAGAKLNWWIRQDSPNWYEGGISCGEYGMDMWSYHESRKAAYRHMLVSLMTQINKA